MPDAKYGRLFTEQDVRSIVDEVLCMCGSEAWLGSLEMTVDQVADEAIERAERAVDKGGLKFPADEPLFLLLASISGDPDLVCDVQAATTMRDWQAANPDRVTVPD